MRSVIEETLSALVVCGVLAAPAGAQGFAPLAGLGSGGYLGVYLTDLSDATRTALGLGKGEGVLVEVVVEGEPAQRAGMQAGDVILEVDGRGVDGADGLGGLLRRTEPGDKIAVVVWRGGKRLTLDVQMVERRRAPLVGVSDAYKLLSAAEAPAIALGRGPYAVSWGIGPERHLGIRTQELTGQLAEYFGVGRGVLLTWVVPDSPAGRAGLKAGDVLVSLGGQPVAGGDDLRLILQDGDEDEVLTAEIVRRGEKKSVPMQP